MTDVPSTAAEVAASDPDPGREETGISTVLSANAPAFVPAGTFDRGSGPAAERPGDDILSQLPESSLVRLRKFFTAYTGEFVAYYVGCLKSYNSRNGYGFIDCAQSKVDFGADVFIHKTLVPNPWHIGQPVEFAVTTNGRGQPQAMDVLWLPALPAPAKQPPPTSQSAISSNPMPSNSSARTSTSATDADAAAGATQPAKAPQSTSALALGGDTRQLGTLKSYSPAQGYGFISCEELYQEHKRDVYFDKSQLPPSSGGFGQAVEFSVMFNASGHPQAYQVDWDPIPLVTMEARSQDPVPPPAKRRSYTRGTLANLRKLLQLLSESNVESAVITAISLQGGTFTAAGSSDPDEPDRDVDFVAFVMIRLGEVDRAVGMIKEVHRLLLLLMLAKMLPLEQNPERCAQQSGWFAALAKAVQPEEGNVHEHFNAIVSQVSNHLNNCSHLREEAQIKAAFQMLQAKAASLAAS